MELHRLVNKILTDDNKELRDKIRTSKNDMLDLNRQILEQRQVFIHWKQSIEEKYCETIDFIYPDQSQTSKLNFGFHRRCGNLKVAVSVKHGSPRAGSSLSAASSVFNLLRTQKEGSLILDFDTDESTFMMPSGLAAEENSRLIKLSHKSSNKFSSRSQSKHPPKIVEEFKTPPKCPQNILNQSESRRKEDLQTETICIGDLSSSETETGGTLQNSNISLVTINEAKSCSSNAPNETLSDVTINCLLDAPCSTPRNQKKLPNGTIFREKKVRVLIKKLSDAQLAQLSIQNNNCSELTKTPLETTLLKSRSVKTVACRSEKNNSELGTSHFTINNSTCKNNINTSEIESFVDPKTIPTKEEATKAKSKRKQNKENNTDSEFNCTNEERRLRTRKVQVSLKEPSLKTKLRNRTNIKL